MKKLIFPTLILLLATSLLTGCESDASRDRRLKAEARRNVAEEDQNRADSEAHQGALRALELNKQYELDVIEHKRTGDVYSHSCRRPLPWTPRCRSQSIPRDALPNNFASNKTPSAARCLTTP